MGEDIEGIRIAGEAGAEGETAERKEAGAEGETAERKLAGAEGDTWRELPVDELDIKGVENWLVQMAAEGYFAAGSSGRNYRFRSGEAGSVRCCLIPVTGNRKNRIRGNWPNSMRWAGSTG